MHYVCINDLASHKDCRITNLGPFVCFWNRKASARNEITCHNMKPNISFLTWHPQACSLHLSTKDILSQVLLCYRKSCLVHCWIFNSTPSLYPLDATFPPRVYLPKCHREWRWAWNFTKLLTTSLQDSSRLLHAHLLYGRAPCTIKPQYIREHQKVLDQLDSALTANSLLTWNFLCEN